MQTYYMLLQCAQLNLTSYLPNCFCCSAKTSLVLKLGLLMWMTSAAGNLSRMPVGLPWMATTKNIMAWQACGLQALASDSVTVSFQVVAILTPPEKVNGTFLTVTLTWK